MPSPCHALAAPPGRAARWRTAAIACSLAGAALAAAAIAQPTPALPDGPVTLLVAAPSGSALDALAAIVQARLGEALRRPVTEGHDASAMTGEAIAAVAERDPGEVRVVLATNSSVIAGRLLGVAVAPRPLRSVHWFGTLARMPAALVVRPDHAAGGFEAWVDALRQAGRALRFAAGPPGSMSELAGRFLGQQTRLPLVHVPFDDMDAAYQALHDDEVDLVIVGLPLALRKAATGESRVLLVTGSDRASVLPEVRAFGELWSAEDFSDLVLLGVGAMVPAAVRTAIAAAWDEMRRGPALRAAVEATGAAFAGQGAGPARESLEAEYLRHARLIARFPPRHPSPH
jgi:tripartite-type tricarboxylate transporter receptor subunit TctC